MLLRLFWLLLLELWGLWLGLGQACGLTMRPIEVNSGGGRWYLTLCFEQTRLQIDDVVAKLVILGL